MSGIFCMLKIFYMNLSNHTNYHRDDGKKGQVFILIYRSFFLHFLFCRRTFLHHTTLWLWTHRPLLWPTRRWFVRTNMVLHRKLCHIMFRRIQHKFRYQLSSSHSELLVSTESIYSLWSDASHKKSFLHNMLLLNEANICILFLQIDHN